LIFDFTKLASSFQTQVISFSGFVKFAIIAEIKTSESTMGTTRCWGCRIADGH